MSLRERWLEHRRNRKPSRPAIVIQTIEGQWPEGFVPLSKRDPERYAEQIDKLRAAGIPVDTGLRSHPSPPEPPEGSAGSSTGWPHAVSCEPECDGTDRYCKCSSIGPCWHHG